MEENSVSRLQGNLDPRAQEFRPRNPTILDNPTQIPLLRPPQVYYPYCTPPLPSPPLYPTNDLQAVPFCEVSMGYPHQFPAHPAAYVGPLAAAAISQLPPASAAPTRTLVLSPVPCDISESTVRRELEVFGEVRGVQMEKVHDGILTVHFYDLRHAEKALREIREQHMQQQTRLRNHYMGLVLPNCSSTATTTTTVGDLTFCAPLTTQARGLVAGHAVWAQFIIPSCNAVPDGNNQGTLVVFNLDPAVSSTSLKEIFQAYGAVRELRETPYKKHQKFVEFYDIRDAAKALKEMNGKEIHGKQVVIEFSRPGGYGKKFYNANNSSKAMAPLSCNNSNNAVINATHCYSRYPPPPSPPPLHRKFSGRSLSGAPPRSYISQTHSSLKKVSYSSKGSPNGCGNGKSSIEAAVGSLSLGGAMDEKVAIVAARKSEKKSQNSQSSKHQQSRTTRPWKSKQMKKFDTRFLINEDAMVESNSKDTRTTVMIKNIPNKYSQKLLLNMLDNHCIHCNEQIAAQGDDQPLSSYDFVYLPIDFNNKCNVGYGFVNMTSPEATWRLYKAFHLQHWEVFNSRKICEVTYARVQGLEALKEHFKNSKFPCEIEHYLPVVFSPPRDGKQLTEPLPIVGHKPTSNGVPSPRDYDQLDNGSDVACESDQAEHEDTLIGGSCSCSSCSLNDGCSGDIGDDDDDDEACCSVVA